jgi:hypothetical protein
MEGTATILLTGAIIGTVAFRYVRACRRHNEMMVKSKRYRFDHSDDRVPLMPIFISTLFMYLVCGYAIAEIAKNMDIGSVVWCGIWIAIAGIAVSAWRKISGADERAKAEAEMHDDDDDYLIPYWLR